MLKVFKEYRRGKVWARLKEDNTLEKLIIKFYDNEEVSLYPSDLHELRQSLDELDDLVQNRIGVLK